MKRVRIEQAASEAATRLTGERYCHGHHGYTKTETKAYRGRHYCLPCSARLTAQRKANRAKDKQG